MQIFYTNNIPIFHHILMKEYDEEEFRNWKRVNLIEKMLE